MQIYFLRYGHLGFTVGYQISWRGCSLDTLTCPNGLIDLDKNQHPDGYLCLVCQGDEKSFRSLLGQPLKSLQVRTD